MGKGIFDEFYGKGKEFIDLAKKPFKRRETKRKFESVFDEASKRIVEIESQIDTELKNFDNLNINKLVELSSEKKAHEEAKEACKEFYLAEFDKELKEREDDE